MSRGAVPGALRPGAAHAGDSGPDVAGASGRGHVVVEDQLARGRSRRRGTSRQAEVAENRACRTRRVDLGDDSHATAAAGTLEHVDDEDALHQLDAPVRMRVTLPGHPVGNAPADSPGTPVFRTGTPARRDALGRGAGTR